MKSSLLLDLQYFPSIPYFTAIAQCATVWIEQHEHYQKGSFRNRCHLAGPNGVLRLSVHLRKGKNEKQSIREVQISYDEPWHHQHWQSIQTAYGNAPYFEFYAGPIREILLQKHRFLFELNLALLQTLLRQLGLNTMLYLTDRYLIHPGEEVRDARNRYTPKSLRRTASPSYAQVFADRHGFLPNLSILDLLFCTGPEAILYLTDSVDYPI